MPQLIKSKRFYLTLILFQFLLSTIYADTTLIFKQKGISANQAENIIYIKNGIINFHEPKEMNSTSTNNNQYSIFDSKTKKLFHINEQQQNYLEIDQQTFDQQLRDMKQQMDQMMAQMQEQMKNMPPEQRKIMQSMMSQTDNTMMMGGDIPNMPSRQKQQKINTGKNDSVADIKCRIYEIIIDYAKAEELCIAEENSFTIDKADIQAMISLRKFIQQMSEKTTTIIKTQDITEQQINGVPVRTRHYDRAGNMSYESTLSTINREDISIDKISIPNGYSKQILQSYQN